MTSRGIWKRLQTQIFASDRGCRVAAWTLEKLYWVRYFTELMTGRGGRPPLPIVNHLQTQNFNHKWQPCSIFDHAAYCHAKVFLWMNEVMLLGVFLKMAIFSTVGILWHPSGIYSEFPNATGSHPFPKQNMIIQNKSQIWTARKHCVRCEPP